MKTEPTRAIVAGIGLLILVCLEITVILALLSPV